MLLLLLAASAAAYAVLLLGYGQAGRPARARSSLVVADWSARPGVATLYENYANPPGVRA